MIKIPFSVYDFFAYLASGSILAVTVDYAFGDRIYSQEKHSLLILFLAALCCYICGHIVAQLSSFLIEHFITRKLLGTPFTILMAPKDNLPKFRGFLFPNFFNPLPQATQKRVAQVAALNGLVPKGEGFFFHVYQKAHAIPRVAERFDAFRNLYGFARNIAGVSLLAAVLLTTAWGLGKPINPLLIPSAFALFIMFIYRYLKFYRLFSVELLRFYSELEISTSQSVKLKIGEA